MKSIEEKAQAYDKVRKKIAIRFGSNVADEFFAEFEESEDEKMRKELIRAFKSLNTIKVWNGIERTDILAWLERQGEHANFLSKIQVGDKVTRNENGVLVNLSQLKRVAKPVDKIEPKFKVGDKIYLKPEYRMPDDDTPIANTVKEIKRIDDKHYRFDGSYIFIEDQDKYELVEQKPIEENKGNICGISPNSAWSEENEPQKELAESYLDKFDKKFPILPTLKGKRLADYKNFLNKCQQIFGLKYWGIHPTQAKLFEKLSLLWAAWGAEHLKGLGQTYGDMDDEILWSEEDEKMLGDIIEDVMTLHSGKTLGVIRSKINWLKSLTPQNRWKPSEDDIIILEKLIKGELEPKVFQATLQGILEQLKKLKKEQA